MSRLVLSILLALYSCKSENRWTTMTCWKNKNFCKAGLVFSTKKECIEYISTRDSVCVTKDVPDKNKKKVSECWKVKSENIDTSCLNLNRPK